VRDERAHAEFVSQGEGLMVVCLGLLGLRGIVSCRNVAEEAQGIRLVAALLALTGERQCLLSKAMGLLQAARRWVSPSARPQSA
jgi:hypothetical protein